MLFLNIIAISFVNEKIVRKPRNVLIDPEVLQEARTEAERSKKRLGGVA